MGYTFISYSRKQLYFAEAIALNLAQFEVETWFDLQQLAIGADWRSSLQAGYENCERLVLIASRAALASPYVELEWQTALQNGREIILVVVENLELPEALQGFPVFDFRTRFAARMRQLGNYMAGQDAPHHDEIPPPGEFPFPLKLPLAIWMALAVQILPFLGAFLFSLLILSVDTILFLLGSLLAGVLMFVLFTRRFWNHDLNYQTVRNIGWVALMIQIVVPFISASYIKGESLFAGFIFLLTALSILNTIVFQLIVLNFSGSLLRWFAAGQATQNFRLRAQGKALKRHRALLREDTLPEPVSLKYYLLHDPADLPIAQRLCKALDKVGHKRIPDYQEAEAQLVIVTNYTSCEVLRWAGENFSGSAVYLLGSPVNSIEDIGPAGNSQWVDIRENNKKVMKILSRGLSDLDAWRREYALAATPKKFEAFHVPLSIETYRYFGYLDTAGLFAAVVSSMLLGKLYGAILSAILAVALLLVMDRFSTRRLPGWFAFLGVLGIPMVHLLLQLNILVILAGLVLLLPRLIIQILAFLIGYHWFPFRSKPAEDILGMDADRKIRRWGYIVISFFFVVYSLLNYGLNLLTNTLGG